MFKKTVLIKSNERHKNNNGAFEWLIKDKGSFFCFSPRPLNINEWYEVFYYQAKNNAFRLKEARPLEPKISINQPQNVFIMNNQIIHYGNCVGNKCFECSIIKGSTPEEYQALINERKELKEARETYEKLQSELTNGLLYLNGKEVKHFKNKKEAEEWLNEIREKREIQWSFSDLNLLRKFA